MASFGNQLLLCKNYKLPQSYDLAVCGDSFSRIPKVFNTWQKSVPLKILFAHVANIFL